MDVIALPLQGGCIFLFQYPGRRRVAPLPWADMLRPFRPSKMYKLQPAGVRQCRTPALKNLFKKTKEDDHDTFSFFQN